MRNRSLVILSLLLVSQLLLADDSNTGIAVAARSQIGKTISYDPSYRSMAYPDGDVPLSGGVCTDVIIRALRQSHGFDLQQEVHKDMKVNFSKYPKIWGLKSTDRNIDHRRVPNLQTFFNRKGYAVVLSEDASDFQPGDIVTCTVPPHLPHIMVVSDRQSAEGVPLVIHNIGLGTKEEDRLFEFKLTGHYRFKKSEGGRGVRPARP